MWFTSVFVSVMLQTVKQLRFRNLHATLQRQHKSYTPFSDELFY